MPRCNPCGFRHDRGVRPEELYTQRPFPFADVHELKGLVVTPNYAVCTDHFRKGEPRAEAPAENPIRIVSHTCERSKKKVAGGDKTLYVNTLQEGHDLSS